MATGTTRTTGHVFIATSLDGFIAREDGSIGWLMKQETGEEDHGYNALMASVDGLVMGRGTFEKVLSFDSWSYEKPVMVMSQTLTEADIPEPLKDKVFLSALTPDGLMRQLGEQGWQHAYIDGGKVIQSFLRAGLIADITLTQIPILIGSGLPLFGSLPQDIDLELIESQRFPSGLVTSKYRVT
jgi:dihydrofolate reductase